MTSESRGGGKGRAERGEEGDGGREGGGEGDGKGGRAEEGLYCTSLSAFQMLECLCILMHGSTCRSLWRHLLEECRNASSMCALTCVCSSLSMYILLCGLYMCSYLPIT